VRGEALRKISFKHPATESIFLPSFEKKLRISPGKKKQWGRGPLESYELGRGRLPSSPNLKGGKDKRSISINAEKFLKKKPSSKGGRLNGGKGRYSWQENEVS